MSWDAVLDLTSLDAMVADKARRADEAMRPSAQAGADVLHKEVLKNVGRLGKKTGRLAAAIYQAYSSDQSGPGTATYHISWNKKKAPHGHLVEFGHVQRYKVYVGKDGMWHTAVRHGAKGKPTPKGRASKAEKDAYYVPLATPRQVPAAAFIRSASSAFPRALDAAEAEFYKRMK